MMNKGREKINFNTEWRFIDNDIESAKEKDFDESNFGKVCLPHSNRVFPHHYFEEDEYRFISWYRRKFYLGQKFAEKLVKVDFDGVMNVATVFVNGKNVCKHKGGYTSFSCDITSAVEFGEQNVISVKVDSTRRVDVPPEGGNVDYMQFGGIYRDVYMRIVDPLNIKDVFVIPDGVGSERAQIKAEIELENCYNENKQFSLVTRIKDEAENIVSERKEELKISARSDKTVKIVHDVAKPNLWYPKQPILYTLETEVNIEGDKLDNTSSKFGIRKIEFGDDGKFYINGEAMKLRGLNRHQTFPYLGAAMPDRIQKKDADILKYELGLNFVRSSHYPPDPSFLDRCDEIGLLVFEEIPGWVYIGDEQWKGIAKQNIKEMIKRDRNHPSIFLWGVRINESFDDHKLYMETNKIAHGLDPTRPTGGVRYFFDSEFLEDVFTINDFEKNLEGKLHIPNHVPHMVTEYAGHILPTKSYDREERLMKHADLHARIQSSQYGIPNMAGASGWCAFDYYTTSGFGAGDHICYHGVCDIFRLPKFAAHFYKSQIDPELGIEVFIARYLTPEFNDYGDKLTVFSNCDRIDLYIDEKKFDSQEPDHASYPNLPHPPFTFEGIQASWVGDRPSKAKAKYEWNELSWGSGRWLGERISKIEAVGIIDGKEVGRHTIEMFGRASRLKLESDDDELVADGTDCTRLIIRIQDEKGQTLPLAHNPVSFELSGSGRLIGENPLGLEGGRGAVYVKSTRNPGIIEIKAKTEGVEGDSIKIHTVEMREKTVPVNKK